MLAKVIKIISKEKADIGIDDAHAVYLAEALKLNRTLKDLRLTGATDHVMAVLSPALKENQTLRSFGFESNSIGDGGCQYLLDALRDNYTLQTVSGLPKNKYSEEIAFYLRRNVFIDWCSKKIGNFIESGLGDDAESIERDISRFQSYVPNIGTEKAPFMKTHFVARIFQSLNIIQCFSPVMIFRDSFAADGKVIGASVDKLRKLIPDIETDSTLHPAIQENYRLLNALGYLSHFLETKNIVSLRSVFELVREAFTLPSMQQTSDVMIAHVLFTIQITDQSVRFSRNLLLLYFLRTPLIAYVHHDSTLKNEFVLMIRKTLLSLQYPELTSTATLTEIPDLKKITGADLLLPYDVVLLLAENALEKCQREGLDEEVTFLTELHSNKNYHPLTARYFFRSPAFLREIARIFPDSNKVRILEEYLYQRDAQELAAQIFPLATISAQQTSSLHEQLENYRHKLAAARRFDFPAYLALLKERVSNSLSPPLDPMSEEDVSPSTPRY